MSDTFIELLSYLLFDLSILISQDRQQTQWINAIQLGHMFNFIFHNFSPGLLNFPQS